MSPETLSQILDLSRWAPSGDNTQPWHFEVVGSQAVRVYGTDTRDHILYDFDGHASHIAHGALMETMRVAATGFGLTTHWHIQPHEDDRNPVYYVQFTESPGLPRSPLFDCIKARTVQRRPMRVTRLTHAQRYALESAAGNDFIVELFESFSERIAISKLLWYSAKIRLTCPEAFLVHRDAIEWRAQFSKDRIPAQAVGVDPVTARLMEWVMHSWERVDFFNRYLFGTVAPRLQLDFMPGLFCAAHLMVRPKIPPTNLADWVRLGVSVQRIWLTATQFGLHLQPQMTPVIFRWYARAGRHFSVEPTLYGKAIRVSENFEQIVNLDSTENFGFFARVGTSKVPQSRSVRHDLTSLMKV